MPYYFFIWDDERVEHLAEHGVTIEEFEAIVQYPERRGVSPSSGRPTASGYTADGRWVYCVFEWVDDITVRPITAFGRGRDEA